MRQHCRGELDSKGITALAAFASDRREHVSCQQPAQHAALLPYRTLMWQAEFCRYLVERVEPRTGSGSLGEPHRLFLRNREIGIEHRQQLDQRWPSLNQDTVLRKVERAKRWRKG